MFKKSIFIILTVLMLITAACAKETAVDEPVNIAPSPSVSTIEQTSPPSQEISLDIKDEQSEQPVKYIFYFIGDGMGEAHKQLSEEFLKYASKDTNAVLNLNTMNVNTMVSTGSTNADITDSAAAATALATGVKTNNHMVGLTTEGEELTTLLEAIQSKGYATGIVTTTRITHATPACFYAHIDHRTHEDDIAEQLLESDIDFIAGGGLCYFLPSVVPEKLMSLPPDIRGMQIYTGRTDAINLVEKFADKGYEMFLGPDGVDSFHSYNPQAGDKVFATLTYNYLPYEVDRIGRSDKFLSLSDMTRQAVRLLSTDEDGFFLMVEGGRIDYAAHNNDILGVIYDTLAFDNAVSIALEFYAAYPDETLIITTADHETGGLRLRDDADYTLAFDSVTGIFASYGDGFAPLYNIDRTFDEYIAGVRSLGLELSDTEISEVKAAFEEALLLDYAEDELDTAASLAINSILNRRLAVRWTSDYHTSSEVALGVTGTFEELFAKAEDNTDIANILSDILKVDVGL